MTKPHTLTLGDTPVAYTLRRSRRRTIGLTIDARGLGVAAPLRARMPEIEAVLHQHQAWVLKKLADWAKRPPPPVAVTPRVESGLVFPWLGEPCTLELTSARQTTAEWHPHALVLAIRSGTEATQAFRRALMASARDHFLARQEALLVQAEALEPPLRFKHMPPLALSSARTRWGSCSARFIRLNWRLMHFEPSLIDYVLAHELAHLHEMNHSPRFWAVVERLCPEWKKTRRALRQAALTCPLF